MFQRLRQGRGLLMGLAILGIVFYHAPLVLHGPWVRLFHEMLNCGVDMFLFLSGLGACHSIAARGSLGYLRQRALRLLPGLGLFLLPWCGVMLALGLMTWPQALGSLTLLGWWVGSAVQLNWYFSAVWLFFLLACPAYALLRASSRPGLWYLLLLAASLALALLCPFPHLLTALTRLPVFFTGMLFGLLEQRGFSHTGLLRGISFALIPVGLWLVGYVNWGEGWQYGYSLGLWWYPYGLFTPGLAILISEIAFFLRKSPFLARFLSPSFWIISQFGDSSAEILMVHVGAYKVLMGLGTYRNRVWILVMLCCLLAGCGYRQILKRLQIQEKICGICRKRY